MKPIVEDDPMTSLEALFDFMTELVLQKLRKRYPRATAKELRRRLDEWLLAAEPLDPREFHRVGWPRAQSVSPTFSQEGSRPSNRKALRSAS